MKILLLTWEFPPFISGGLGMACYGLIRALLELGVEVDMLLPTEKNVIFQLRTPDDVDNLPYVAMDKRMESICEENWSEDVQERMINLGYKQYPDSYVTPAQQIRKKVDRILNKRINWKVEAVDDLSEHIYGEEDIFKQVRFFTERVLKNAHNLLGYDLIHTHDWLTYPAAVPLKDLLEIPLISHIHATEFDRSGGEGDDRIHKIEYAGLTSADRVISVSQYTSRMIMDRYVVHPKKVRVVYNAYSMSPLRKKRRKVFKDLMVLFLGRVTIQKGPDYFLEVARRVLDKYPNVRFVMAGSGDMFNRMVHNSASKRLKDRFLFSGFLNRDQVEEILSGTDIFIMPSVSEPFGIVPLEAMAYGAVAVVSKQSGVSEVIHNAYKIDFWDIDRMTNVILELLENPKQRESVALAGQQEALSIGWYDAAVKAIDVYKETICSI